MRSRNSISSIFLVLLLLSSFILNGCYDMKELDNRGFVLASGVEKGKKDNIRFTVMIASPKKLSGGPQGGGGGDEKEGLVVTSVEAPTIPLAINIMNSYIGRTLYLGHSGYIFLSEDFARKGYVTNLMSPQRLREIRRDANVFVVKGDVMDFMNQIKPKIAANPVKYLRQIVDSYNNTGFIPNTVLYKLYSNIESFKIDAILPLCSLNKMQNGDETTHNTNSNNQFNVNYKAGNIIRKDGLPIEFIGSGIFKGNIMVSTINANETRLYNLIRGNMLSTYFSFPDIKNPKYFQTVLIKRGKTPKVKVDLSGNKPKLNILISLDGDLIYTEGYSDFSKKENISKLEEEIENILSTESNSFVKKMQRQNTDIFGFGYEVAKKFWTWDEYQKYNWLVDKYKKAQIDIKYSYQIRRIGYQGGATKPGD